MSFVSSKLKKCFFHNATCKTSAICKISTFFEDLRFLNSRSHLKLRYHQLMKHYLMEFWILIWLIIHCFLLFNNPDRAYFRIQRKHQTCSEKAHYFTTTSWPDSPKLMTIYGIIDNWSKQVIKLHTLLWHTTTFAISLFLLKNLENFWEW